MPKHGYDHIGDRLRLIEGARQIINEHVYDGYGCCECGAVVGVTSWSAEIDLHIAEVLTDFFTGPAVAGRDADIRATTLEAAWADVTARGDVGEVEGPTPEQYLATRARIIREEAAGLR
jgi:hypothetical protein